MTADERNSNSDPAVAPISSPDEKARSLIGLAARMDEFLDAVGSRLAVIFNECERAVAEKAGLFRKASQFQQERNDWEKQRQKEIAQIRDECRQLAEAWTRLEESDRDRLSGSNGQNAPRAEADQDFSVVDTSSNRGTTMRPAEPQQNPALIEVNSTSTRPVQTAAEISPISILMQFQQLKRDIRNHAQRKS